MVKRKTAIAIRKAHRYLGLFLGVQFLFWTISGLYFSWTNIDDIHGDHFKKEVKPTAFKQLNVVPIQEDIKRLELRAIAGEPYYWVNDTRLIHARTGIVKEEISQEEALAIASQYMIEELKVKAVKKITTVDKHHEYRGRPLPAYQIAYEHPDNVTAYVSIKEGKFQRVRHRSWRWFDFLWMTHTMDYEGRDDFNTITLRVFSFLGLITVCSGFVLWFVSSPNIRKLKKKK